MQYEEKEGQFNLGRKLSDGFDASFGGSAGLRISHGADWPDPVIPVDEAEARKFIQKVNSWTHVDPATKKVTTGRREVSVVGVVDLVSVDYQAQRMDVRLVSLGLSKDVATMEAVQEITSVRLLSREPHFSDLLTPDIVKAHEMAPPQRESRETVIFESRLKEVIYFDAGGKEVARLSPKEEFSVKGLLDAVVAAKAGPKPDGPYGFEMIGIQLGMTTEEAEKIIRKHMDVGRVLEGKRLYDGSVESGLLIPSTSGKLFILKDERELVAIIDEPPAAAGKVLAAWRRVYTPAGTLPYMEAVVALREKYGDSTPNEKVEGGLNVWRTVAGHDCKNFYRLTPAPALSASWREKSMPTVKECGPFMVAQLNFQVSVAVNRGRKTKQMDWIEQNLTDMGPYMQAYKANRDAAQRGKESNGDPQQTGGTPTGLKF